MPELPEVETVRRGLTSGVVGRAIVQVTVREHRLRWPIPAGFGGELVGATIAALDRRGKYLLFRLDDGRTLLCHLGMSGQLRWCPPGAAPAVQRHDHVDISFDDGSLLRYCDPRRFGALLLYAGPDGEQRLLAHLGAEPLTEAFTAHRLKRSIAGRRTAIKAALMDAEVVVGVGNIYANEALFRAGIRPTTPAGRLGLARCERLVAAVKDVLADAIEAGGASLRDFVHADGGNGYFQLDCLVYGRGGEPCRVCAAPLKAIRQIGRSTVYCPRCQR